MECMHNRKIGGPIECSDCGKLIPSGLIKCLNCQGFEKYTIQEIHPGLIGWENVPGSIKNLKKQQFNFFADV